MSDREPWIREDGSIDAVAMQRALRARVQEALEGKSPEEQIRWIEEHAARFREKRSAHRISGD